MGLRILLVEGDGSNATARAAELTQGGFEPVRVADAKSAAEVMMRESIDSILCEETARAELEKAYGNLIPIVPMAGQPTATLLKTLARLARRSMSPNTQLSLAAQLDEALANGTLAAEPIIQLRDGSVWGHRGKLLAPNLTEESLLMIARELGRVRELRRVFRDRIAGARGRVLAVCETEDLLDPALYEAGSTWAARASETYLALAQHDIAEMGDAPKRLADLRALGFPIVLEIDSDIAGLASVGVVVPTFAMVDVTGAGALSTRALGALVAGCREANVDVIAVVANSEGLATAKEAGCALAVGALA